MAEKLAVITVLYENYSILEDLLSSLKTQTDGSFSLFISDLSKNRKHISLPFFASLWTGENKGYAYGVNMGIKRALELGYENFSIINSDTVLDGNFVKNTKQSLSKNKGSIIGGKIYYSEGYEYHKGRYRKDELGRVLWYAGGRVDWDHALTPHRGVDEVDDGQYDQFEKTDFVNGCLMCVDKNVIDTIGFWDESYFLYFEDADYSERAKRKNIPLYYDPRIILYHKNAQSTQGSGSPIHQYYQKKNRLRFGLKYAPLRTKVHLLKNFICDRITGTSK